MNINTADLAVLEALFPAEGKDLARAFYEYRQETEDLASLHDLNNAAWYKEVPGLGEIDINPELIRTDSDIFRLEAVATRQNMDMTAVAVVERVKDPESGRWSLSDLELADQMNYTDNDDRCRFLGLGNGDGPSLTGQVFSAATARGSIKGNRDLHRRMHKWV